MNERRKKLLSFLKLLDDHDMIAPYYLNEDSEDGFTARFKLHKYVFLAKYFGLDLGYEFDKYFYGPYSSELAEEIG